MHKLHRLSFLQREWQVAPSQGASSHEAPKGQSAGKATYWKSKGASNWKPRKCLACGRTQYWGRGLGCAWKGCRANPENEARRRQEELETRERAAKQMMDEATEAREEVRAWKEAAAQRLHQLEDKVLAQPHQEDDKDKQGGDTPTECHDLDKQDDYTRGDVVEKGDDDKYKKGDDADEQGQKRDDNDKKSRKR
jgi:hypothetical protein